MNENNITYLVGKNVDTNKIHSLMPFNNKIVDFLDDLSKELLSNKEAKLYPDVVTFAFYIRRANVLNIKNRFYNEDANNIKLGRGIAFHIAPSNVPVNFAYSLVASLFCGNLNIVKVSSKNFIQVDIICDAINRIISKYSELINFISIVRYQNNKEINDYFSSICDVRIIWGGDETIKNVRESSLKPRAREITFADRYSLLIVDSNFYDKLNDNEKKNVANAFYNDTFLTDQNACTSPRIIFFKDYVSEEFYKYAESIIKEKYYLNEIACSDKLVEISKFAIKYKNLKPQFIRNFNENFIFRILIDNLDKSLLDFKGNQGLFVEYVFKDINDIKILCDDERVQTISYVGDKSIFEPLINSGLKGIDRIVPIGKTMDFDMIWDGYNLYEMLIRNVVNI